MGIMGSKIRRKGLLGKKVRRWDNGRGKYDFGLRRKDIQTSQRAMDNEIRTNVVKDI